MTFAQLKRPPRHIHFTCDGCSSEFLETEEFTLREAMPVLRDAHWHVAEIDGEYNHYCPGCARRLGID